MKKKKNKFGLIPIFLVAMLIANMLSLNEVSAATKSVTPMNPWRYVNKTANYQVNSTLDEYKDIWSKAANKWCDKGFKWVKANKSKTSVSTYSDASEAGLKIAGKCTTTYRIKDGYIIKNKVLLNRAALDKYDYTKSQRICVAEHELGHALGLAHNNQGSESVMNPANRIYGIKDCDVRGMEKRYSTKINNDVVGDAEETITQTEYFYIDAPEVKNVKVKYSNDKIIITGKAEGVKKVIAHYDKVKKTAKVKAGKFKVEFKYTNEKNIQLYGVNSKNEKITKNKTIKSDRYVTLKPECIRFTRTEKGITCDVRTEAGSLLIIKNNGKVLKKQVVDSSVVQIFISEKKLKGRKGNLVFTQKNTNKKTSKRVSYPMIKVGETTQTQY